MYFINVKMKKPSLCYCFTWIIFIELNFTVVFLVIRKTWEDQFDIHIWTMNSQYNQKPLYVAIFYFFIKTIPKILLAKFKDF